MNLPNRVLEGAAFHSKNGRSRNRLYWNSPAYLMVLILCAYIYHFQPNENNKTRFCDYITVSFWEVQWPFFKCFIFLVIIFIDLANIWPEQLLFGELSWVTTSLWPDTGKHKATVQCSCGQFGNKRHCQSRLTGSHKEQEALGLPRRVDQGSGEDSDTNHSCRWKQNCRKNAQ